MNRIREILLTDYIGAITAAILFANGLFSLIGTLIRTVFSYFNYRRTVSVLDSPGRHVNLESLLNSVLIALLSIGMGYLLASWLHPKDVSVDDTHSPDDSADQLEIP